MILRQEIALARRRPRREVRRQVQEDRGGHDDEDAEPRTDHVATRFVALSPRCKKPEDDVGEFLARRTRAASPAAMPRAAATVCLGLVVAFVVAAAARGQQQAPRASDADVHRLRGRLAWRRAAWRLRRDEWQRAA